MLKVLITGGAGLIGQELSKKLISLGCNVAILTRAKSRATLNDVNYYPWDVERSFIDKNALVYTDIIIHLAGESVDSGRWTQKRKKEILDSRVQTTELIYTKLKEYHIIPKCFISASAVGYYGSDTTSEIWNENDNKGNDFLADVCNQWEKAVFKIKDLGIRTAILRTGVVLSKHGGMLKKVLPLAKLGLHAPLGKGNQFLPWIHIDDLIGMYVHVMKHNDAHGIFNAVSTEFVDYKSFSKKLALILERPILIPPIPAIALKLIFGEMAQILLNGSRVSNEKIKNSGYVFKFPELQPALQDIIL